MRTRERTKSVEKRGGDFHMSVVRRIEALVQGMRSQECLDAPRGAASVRKESSTRSMDKRRTSVTSSQTAEKAQRGNDKMLEVVVGARWEQNEREGSMRCGSSWGNSVGSIIWRSDTWGDCVD